MDRRDLLRATAAVAGSALLWRTRFRRSNGTRLILLGTGGGPRPRRTRSAPAQVILVDDTAYVIDCGDGVARQLVLAGVSLPKLRHIFITHHHSDHNADYGNLILLAWSAGLKTRLDSWGPPPLVEMTRQFLEMNAPDIAARIADEGRMALAPLIHAHEFSEGVLVMEDASVAVHCVLVDHPPMVPSFAYRFDTPGRSIVISGDTRPCERLIRLARGADVLVHEALYPPAIDRLVAGVDNATHLKESIRGHHTSVEDAGRVAQAAGVKTLVLSHLVPAEDPLVTDQLWLEGARKHFRGEIIVGRDLLEI